MINILFILLSRLFSSRRCARCGIGISSSELVMRARELVFHVGCFCCILCGIHLSAGDTAAVRSGRVFCGEHYDADILRQGYNDKFRYRQFFFAKRKFEKILVFL